MEGKKEGRQQTDNDLTLTVSVVGRKGRQQKSFRCRELKGYGGRMRDDPEGEPLLRETTVTMEDHRSPWQSGEKRSRGTRHLDKIIGKAKQNIETYGDHHISLI